MILRDFLSSAVYLVPEIKAYLSPRAYLLVVDNKAASNYARDKREPDRAKKEKITDRIATLFYQRWQKHIDIITQKARYMKPLRIKSILDEIDIYDDDNKFEIELAQLLAELARLGITRFSTDAEIDIAWELTNEKAAKWALAYSGKFIKGIDETSLGIVRSVIRDFVNTPGMTIGDIINRLPYDRERALRIAITEVTRAYAEGQKIAGEDLKKAYPDVEIIKTWFTNNDDKVCDICGPNNGAEVSIDDVFPSGDDMPPAHVNCRCWTSSRTQING